MTAPAAELRSGELMAAREPRYTATAESTSASTRSLQLRVQRGTVEVWPEKSLDDGQPKQEISWRHPAFDNNISAMIQISYVRGSAAIAFSLRSGITTGPPPNILVPIHFVSFHFENTK